MQHACVLFAGDFSWPPHDYNTTGLLCWKSCSGPSEQRPHSEGCLLSSWEWELGKSLLQIDTAKPSIIIVVSYKIRGRSPRYTPCPKRSYACIACHTGVLQAPSVQPAQTAQGKSWAGWVIDSAVAFGVYHPTFKCAVLLLLQ